MSLNFGRYDFEICCKVNLELSFKVDVVWSPFAPHVNFLKERTLRYDIYFLIHYHQRYNINLYCVNIISN